MPDHCGICNALYHGVLCHVVFKSPDERPKNCPLVEVPESHGRLIDFKELKKDLIKRWWNVMDDQDFCNEEVWHALEDAPTVIEAEEEDHDCGKSEKEKK